MATIRGTIMMIMMMTIKMTMMITIIMTMMILAPEKSMQMTRFGMFMETFCLDNFQDNHEFRSKGLLIC